MRLRPLVTEDGSVVAPISRAARFEAIPDYPDLHTTEEDLAFYTREIETSQGLLAEDDDGRALGFVLWRDAMINHLYVAIGDQRRGVGSALLTAAVEAIDGPEVTLWMFRDNAKATASSARASRSRRLRRSYTSMFGSSGRAVGACRRRWLRSTWPRRSRR